MPFPKTNKMASRVINSMHFIFSTNYVKLFPIPYTDLLKKRSKWIYIDSVNERCLYKRYIVTQVMHLRYFAMDSFNKKVLQQGILQFWNGIVTLYFLYTIVIEGYYHLYSTPCMKLCFVAALFESHYESS